MQVDALEALSLSLRQVGSSSSSKVEPADLARELDKVTPRLMECIEDSHHKVGKQAVGQRGGGYASVEGCDGQGCRGGGHAKLGVVIARVAEDVGMLW